MPDLFYKKTKKEIKKYITSDQQIAWRNILNNFIKQLRLKKKVAASAWMMREFS